MTSENHEIQNSESGSGLNRREAMGRLGVAVAAGAVLATVPKAASAQDVASREGHPLVGSWIITGPSGSPDAVNSFDASGIAQTSGRAGFGSDAAGFQTSAAVGFGVWEPTGANTAAFTWIVPTKDDAGNKLNIYFRGVIEVSAEGNDFMSFVVLDVQTTDGTSMVQFPNQVVGKRIVVEPMPEFQAPPESASPVASPVG